MDRRIGLAGLLLLAVVGSASPATWAQDYPMRPVRIIVGFAAGSVTDIMARIVGQKLGESLGQQFVIDNRPGAGSAIASEITAKAAPDGYTLLMIGTSFAINAGVYKKLPYDPVKDFAGVILVSSAPQVLVANLSLPAKSLTELIDLARAKPGQLNFASSGNGSTSHLAGELLKSMAKINLAHVPYKGGSAVMMTDVMSGRGGAPVPVIARGVTADQGRKGQGNCRHLDQTLQCCSRCSVFRRSGCSWLRGNELERPRGPCGDAEADRGQAQW